jgi:ABC-type antimicrobial peptide transport system permease subunit
MDEWRRRSVAEPRFSLVLLVGFAAFAVLLAAVGVYGVLAFSVARRTRELGIRLALGARPGGVLRLVLREAAVLSGLGIALGAGAGIAAAGMLRAIFAEVRMTDPAVLAGVPAIVLLVAIAAALLPARRAMRVDPVQALRAE